MVSQAEWMHGIGMAADELGYGITQAEPRRVELVSLKDGIEVTIDSVFLSGDLLRKVLVPRPKEPPADR